MRPIRILLYPAETAFKATSVSPPSISQQRSPWHSPVPYLFGGLAAMLGLIALALLILACSYWRLSGNFNNEGGEDRNSGTGEKESGSAKQVPAAYEEKILVIMAGEEKPTFLATPVSSRVCSLGEKSCEERKTEDSEKTKNGDQKVKEEEEEGLDHRRIHQVQDQQAQQQN